MRKQKEDASVSKGGNLSSNVFGLKSSVSCDIRESAFDDFGESSADKTSRDKFQNLKGLHREAYEDDFEDSQGGTGRFSVTDGF